MMAHTTALITQPATTPATLEEESSSSSDGTAVAVTDVDEEIAILVDNSVVDLVIELVVLVSTVAVADTDEELAILLDNSVVDMVIELVVLADKSIVIIGDISEELIVLVDDSIVVVVEIDRAIEELAVLVDNSTVPVLGITEDNVTVIGKINTVGMISSYIMQYKLSITI